METSHFYRPNNERLCHLCSQAPESERHLFNGVEFPLELERPLVIFDTETTGVHFQVDRILALALVKIYPEGRVTMWSSLFNPGTAIPPEATKVHGITDEMVQTAPRFRDKAATLAAGFRDCDYAGYNVFFDLRMLKAELVRAGIPMTAGLLDGRVLDSYRIFSIKHPRNLEAAAKLYLDEAHDNAHDALADTLISARVLCAQLEQHPELPRTVGELSAVLSDDTAPEPDGKTFWRFGEAYISFGKHAGTPLKELTKDYIKWLLGQDFPEPFKELLRRAMDGTLQRRKEQ